MEAAKRCCQPYKLTDPLKRLGIHVLIDAEKAEQLPKPVKKAKNDRKIMAIDPGPLTYAVYADVS